MMVIKSYAKKNKRIASSPSKIDRINYRQPKQAHSLSPLDTTKQILKGKFSQSPRQSQQQNKLLDLQLIAQQNSLAPFDTPFLNKKNFRWSKKIKYWSSKGKQLNNYLISNQNNAVNLSGTSHSSSSIKPQVVLFEDWNQQEISKFDSERIRTSETKKLPSKDPIHSRKGQRFKLLTEYEKIKSKFDQKSRRNKVNSFIKISKEKIYNFNQYSLSYIAKIQKQAAKAKIRQRFTISPRNCGVNNLIKYRNYDKSCEQIFLEHKNKYKSKSKSYRINMLEEGCRPWSHFSNGEQENDLIQ